MSSTVELRPSGHRFAVAEDESILDAALRQGIALPYGCRGGFCGECHGQVEQGAVDYPGDRLPPGLLPEDAAQGVAFLCQARPRGEVVIRIQEVEEAASIPVRQLTTQVVRKVLLGEEVMGLFLQLPAGERLQYLAGQYVEFILADGKRRAFSIASPPHADNPLEFHIRHNQGGAFTDALFQGEPELTSIQIEGPKGSFFLRENSSRAILMLATGTGFGPIKGIIEHAIAEGCQRPIYLYWGARTQAGLYLHALAEQWAQQHPNIHYIPVLSRPEAGWGGRSGHVQEAALADFADLSDFELYACGHPQMVYQAKEMLGGKGLPPEHCYSDAFEWAKD